MEYGIFITKSPVSFSKNSKMSSQFFLLPIICIGAFVEGYLKKLIKA